MEDKIKTACHEYCRFVNDEATKEDGQQDDLGTTEILVPSHHFTRSRKTFRDFLHCGSCIEYCHALLTKQGKRDSVWKSAALVGSFLACFCNGR